tara:strand:+ start:2939 stop:3133 length:195 start_codon:yes stop_codon:yes gene_type:complete
MSYTENPEAKMVIDCVLRRNAKMFTNLGIDSGREEYEKARALENERLRRIRRFDPEKIDRLLIE